MKNVWNKMRDFVLKDLWAIDITPLGRAKAFSIEIARLLIIIVQDIIKGPLTLWAMSLVYTTMLSLVPLLAVSFSVLKAFGVHDKVEPLLFNLLAPLGPRGPELADRIMGFVNNMKVGVLGAVGLALLVYTVVSLIQKVEESFNALWRVRNLRSILRRFSDYLSVILVGPVLVIAAIGLTASILNTALMQYLISVGPIGTAISYLGKLVPYLLVCAAFTFMYIFVPNTKVKFASALVGGIVGGFLWETIGWGFGSFIVTSTRYSAVYSGFAIVILFIIWLYVSWLILLVGADISFYWQNPQALTVRGEARISNAGLIEHIAVSIMFLIADSFYRGRNPLTLTDLVHRLGLVLEPVEDIVLALKRNQLIVEAGGDASAYLPARDIAAIGLRDIYAAVRLSGPDSAGFERRNIVTVDAVDRIGRSVDAAIERALGEVTLRDLVIAGGEKRPE
jgi:membrane protein